MTEQSSPLLLRSATVNDLEFVYATERLAGYERLTARWSLEEHQTCWGRPDTRYLIGRQVDGLPVGFVIFQPVADRHEGAKIKRIAVTTPGLGFGRALLVGALEWLFTETSAHRVWLDVFTHNTRAISAYRGAGFTEDGVFRGAYEMDGGERVDRLIMSMLRDEWRMRTAT